MKKILEILSKKDPMNLISLGAPADEYSSEAEHIHEKIKLYGSVSAAEVEEIFSFMFWENCISRSDCEEIANEISHLGEEE